jgi:hypothetical protein
MATDTAGDVGQEYVQNMTHYLSKAFTYLDDGSVLTLGTVPPNAAVIRGGVIVTTAFNAGSTNVLDIGTSSDDDGFATDLALGTIGVISADEMATTNDSYATTARTITATVDLTGAAATAGAGIAWVEYIVVGR